MFETTGSTPPAMFSHLPRGWRAPLARRRTHLILAALLGTSMWLQLHSILFHDQAWIIHGTEVLLNGGRLYREVFEVNPPLIFYLTAPPVWVAHLLGVFDVNVFIIYVFILIAICLTLLQAVLRGDGSLSPKLREPFLLSVAVVLAIFPAERFGQREHLMLILSLPYLLLVGTRSRHFPVGTPLALLIGAVAAFGFALKPHFLLVPAAAECYLAVRSGGLRRCIRPETLALAGIVLLYAASILYFTPDYLTVIVPFALEVYGLGYGSPLLVVLARPELILLPVAVLFHLHSRSRQYFPQMGDILTISSGCFFVIYVMQMKGWEYHIYPLDATLFLLLTSTFLQSDALEPLSWRYPYLSTIAIGLSICILTTAGSVRLYNYVFKSYNEFMREMAPFVLSIPSGSSIYVFSAGVFNGFPFVNYYGLGWPSRFDTFWLLPGLVTEPRPSPRIEKFLRDAVVADLTKQPPALIFVDVGPRRYRFETLDFDYIRYFSADPRFVAIWSHYDEVASVGEFRVYRRHLAGGRE